MYKFEVSPDLTWRYATAAVDISLDDLLGVLAKCKLLSKRIDFAKIPQQDAIALKTLLALPQETSITLKDFVLERSKISSQSLEEILEYLNLEKIEQIITADLLTNLLHAHLVTHNTDFCLYDIATVILQYMTIKRFKNMVAEQHTTATLNFIDCFSATGNVTASLKNVILEEFAGLLHESKLANIKLGNYAQLNQIIVITDEVLPSASLYIGAAFTGGDTNEGLHVIPFGILLQIYQQLSDFNCKRILPAPIFGCFDFEIFENLVFNRKQRYRPITLPCYLSTIKSLFYGVTGGKNNPTYDNESGFKDMMIAHGFKCGYFGVLMHDLYHLSYNAKHAKMMGIMDIEAELFPALRKMLQDERFKDDHKFIENKLFQLMDTEFVCAASLEDLRDHAKHPVFLEDLRRHHNNKKLALKVVESNLHALSSRSDTEDLSFNYYRSCLTGLFLK